MNDDPQETGPRPAADAGAAPDPSAAPTRAEAGPGLGVEALEASLTGWDRYEVLGFLAKGGMGRVYKARDRKLGRLVALKFIASDSLTAARRFAQEAQAQARVEHEAVCRIHEVGEWLGQPYIALQYIDGTPLNECLKELGIEVKADLMRRVAEGLHAAHRLGLIHRDIKTGNIMVERLADGRLQPYVMDFGLARAQEAPGLTQTGLIVGTPAFMAPEQARGDADAVDRRSDVYSLGATLYEVFTGKLPFDARTSVDVFVAILTEEPRPLRQLVPSLPADLESITLKCLEKDPARRYDSAQALADDLRRFLDGEPVRARQIGPVQRLQRRIRKHPAVSALVTGSVLAALVLGGWGLRATLRAKAQAALAQEFGQEAAQIDALLRYGHLLPMHDLRAEKAAVRERMASITARMAKLGAVAEGPGRAALGRGHLALGDLGSARKELERAWHLGHRPPEAVQALGQAFAGLYQEALAEARKLPDPVQREGRKRALAAEFRDPALRYLEAGRNLPGSRAYTEGLIALQEERFDEALRKAGESTEQVPWFYEALALEGQIWRARAAAEAERGEYGSALAAARKAGEAYDRARTIARSDDTLLLGKAGTLLIETMVAVEQGRATEEPFSRGLEALEEARRADPHRAESFELEARFHWLQASDFDNSGRDGREALRASIRAAETALRLDPGGIRIYERLANAWWYLSQQETNRGGDGGPALLQAEEAVRRGQILEPGNGSLYRSLGVIHGIRAEAAFRAGQDPGPALEASVGAFRKALAANPDSTQAYGNLSNALHLVAEMKSDRGDDPRADLEAAEASLAKALELNPQSADFWDERGKVRFRLALHRFDQGGDPRPDLGQALGHFQAALGRNPAMPQATVHRAQALLLKATYLRAVGQEAWATLGEAEQAARRAREIIRDYAEIAATFVDVLLVKAELLAEGRRPVEATLAEGREALASALKRDAGSPFLWERRAQIELLAARLSPAAAARHLPAAGQFLRQAEALGGRSTMRLNLRARLAIEAGLRAPRGAGPELQSGLEALERSAALNPRQPEVRALRAVLFALRARDGVDADLRRRDAEACVGEFKAALAANPLLLREWRPLLDEARRERRER
jgi:serine/threonine-protein kinase